MNFTRLLVVVLVVTLCGAVFGTVVGGLMGWLAPKTFLGAMFGLWSATEHQSRPLQGAAAGGIYGLVAGAVIAVGVGLLDQVLIVVKQWMRNQA